MADLNIGPKPDLPGSNDPMEMMKYQREMADYNFALQTMQQTQNEEQTTRTNMSKSRHDAMMAIAANMKS